MTEKTIVYDQEQSTCAEIWEEDAALICELSYGFRCFEEEAAMVLNAAIQDDTGRYLIRDVVV